MGAVPPRIAGMQCSVGRQPVVNVRPAVGTHAALGGFTAAVSLDDLGLAAD